MGEPFADPDVDEAAIEEIREIAAQHEPLPPWELLDHAEDAGVPRSEARLVLRKLRMANDIVPAYPFVGDIRLVD